MIIPALRDCAWVLWFLLLLSPLFALMAAIIVAASPRARTRMPGGARRMFAAVMIECLGIGLVVAVLTAIERMTFGPHIGIDRSLFAGLTSAAACLLSYWILRSIPWVSRLVKDLADARRRPPRSTNFGKA